MIGRTVLFLVLNFAALAIGGLFTGSGVNSEWYQNLNQAPWTPPGWVFGAAWTSIMIFFAFYMAFLLKPENKTTIILLYGIQWVLNVAWNPVFFYFHAVTSGLICIMSLTILVAFLFFHFRKDIFLKSLLLVPYLVWLIIATSLNAYIVYYN